MNWYKTAQYDTQQMVEEEYATDTGNTPPVDPPDDDSSGGGGYEPDERMARRIYEWFEKEGYKLFSSDIFEMILENTEPDVMVYSPIKNNPTTSNFKVRGDAQINISFMIQEDNPILSILEQNIKMSMLNSSLWKYLGIPYENAMNYLSSGSFMQVILWSAVRFAIKKGSNHCKFWVYSNVDKYLDQLKERILSTVYGFGFQNADPATLEISKNGDPECGGQVGMRSMNDPTLSLYIGTRQYFRYSISPWAFKQDASKRGFENLSPENQKHVMADLAMIIDDMGEETDIVNDLNIEFEVSGKYYPGTREDPPEYPEVYVSSIEPSRVSQQFKFDGGEIVLSTLSPDDLNIVLNTIPKELLKIFKYQQLISDKVIYPIYGEDNDEDVEVEILMTMISGNAIENGVELVFNVEGDIKGFG